MGFKVTHEVKGSVGLGVCITCMFVAEIEGQKLRQIKIIFGDGESRWI
jgi:hypothetical protein